MPRFCPIFFIKIVSAVFEIFGKKRSKKKKTLFPRTITILDHTLYGKVKNGQFEPLSYCHFKANVFFNLFEKIFT